MIKIRYLIYALVVSAMVCLLAGCGGTLSPQGYIAYQEKEMLIVSISVMALVVIPVILLCLFIVFHYRSSNHKATYSPEWSHSTLLEVFCWGIPCLIIIALSVIAWVYTHRLDPYKPIYGDKSKPLTIQVVALNWRWLFIYPEQHVASMNFMQIPVNRDIQLLITSDGPMNSLQIPQLAGQIYGMADMQTKLHFDAYTAGDYRGLSTNYSGDGFSGMMFTVRAGSNADFNAWVKQAQKSSDKLTIARMDQLLKPSTDTQVLYFSAPAKDAYSYVMKRYDVVIPVETPAKPQSLRAKHPDTNHAK